jgi:hypothetical protein
MSPRASSRRLARAALAVCLTTTALAGCARVRRAPADWRDRLLSTARAASFGADAAPVRNDNEGPEYPRDVPVMRFAQSTAPRGRSAVVTRVTSERAYERLGIAEGVNYVWVVAGKTPRIAVVPADPSRPAHWIVTAPHAPTGGDVCQQNPNASQLSIERSGGRDRDDAAPGGPSAAPTSRFFAEAAMCICVGGSWYHGGTTSSVISQRDASLLLQ